MSLIKPYYKLFLPEEALEFSVQWENCFTGLSSFLADGKFRAFRIHVFIYTNGNKDYALKSEVIYGSFYAVFGNRLPPVAILPQAPEYPVQVMIEAGLAHKVFIPDDGNILDFE